MSQTPSFHPAVLAAREKLASGHQRMQAQHERGSPGVQVCAGLTALVDEVLLDLYRAALDELPTGSQLASQVVLVAHGGYGRRRMAPFSDVDLMLLCEPLIRDQLAPLAQLLTQFVFDAGLQLGLATRTAREAWELAGRDVEVLTSLAESRFLIGSEALFQRYLEGLRRRTLRRSRSLVASINQARREERAGWGDTVFGDYADDVAAVAADLGRVVLVGHSMGGTVVQRLLCRRDRPPVAGAALLASVPPRGVIRVTAQVAREEPGVFAITNLTVDLGRLVASREQVRNLFLSADADDEVVGWLHQRVQKESYLAFLGMLTPHRPRRRPSLPVLVLGAANDRIFTVPEVEATAAAWGTTAHIVPGLAHDVMLDSRWMDAADVLEAWLRRSMTLTNGH